MPDKLDISSYDLNIILGNLLDNSVQSTILTQAPSINIRIEYKTGILYIYVSNSSLENSVTYKNNKIISTKGSNHGYGISNIDKIVKKYNGTYKIDCINNEFKSSILIHLCS